MLWSASPPPFLEPDPRSALPDWTRTPAISPIGIPPEVPAPDGTALAPLPVSERDFRSRGSRRDTADSSRDPLTGEPFNRLQVLPEDGRRIYRKAFALAERQIRIEICVLEDPKILASLGDALDRGVRVRAIVDRGKYEALKPERQNLAAEFVAAGGELHLSNPIFPRSFPKTILIDSKLLVYGSACLDSTTFAQYRDFALSSTDPTVLRTIRRLFANDWTYSAPVGQKPPAFNPTPAVAPPELLIAPRNAAAGLADLYQQAERRLDVYTEELGNAALESELVAAVTRGVRVRMITPVQVNGASEEQNNQHTASIQALVAAGVKVRTSGPLETFETPYMHARAARVDDRLAYVGSINLSPDSATVNREMGLIEDKPTVVKQLGRQFIHDYRQLAPVV